MPTPKSSVLVVDDQPEVRKALRMVLEKTGGYAVAEAAEGEEAVTLARESPPDVVLLDISMPGTNGIAAIPRLLEVSPTTKIVVLSSHYGMDKEVLAMGAHAFLTKTTPPKELVKTLEDLLRS